MLSLVTIGLFSCQEESNISTDQKIEEILNKGDWRITSTEYEFKRFSTGLKFSEDSQVFNVDSQGQIVVPSHERIYSIYGDTLKFVDYKYEERFLFSKGTDLLLIEKISEDELILNAIHPKGPNRITFENID